MSSPSQHSAILQCQPNDQIQEGERKILQSVMDGAKNSLLVYLDREFNFVRVNKAYASRCGYRPEEMIGKNHFVLYPHAENEAIFIKVRDTGEAFEIHDKPFIFPNHPELGVTYWDWTLTPVKDSNGQVEGLVFSLFETTERKRMEVALAESEERFRSFMDNSSAIAWIKDEQGRYTYLNKSFKMTFGVKMEDWYGKTDHEVWPQEIANEFRKNDLAVLKADHPLTLIEESMTDDNDRLIWLNTKFPYRDSVGKRFVGSIGIDITEQKRTEEKLNQSRKMEAIGHMAGGMAHNFNNLLAAMLLNINLIQPTSLTPQMDQGLKGIQTLIEKAAELIKQLIGFCGRSIIKFELLNLGAVVTNQAQKLARRVNPRIRIEIDCPSDLPFVNADREMIEQVLYHIYQNACQAMENGGLLRLQLKEVMINEEQVKTHLEARTGKYLCLSITDTGTGMDELTLQQIFVPFFTTKEEGKGIGLGLPTAYGIIHQHNGWIEVQSTQGVGSTFFIYLPVIQNIPVTLPASSLVPKESKEICKPVILLVEDSSILRITTSTMLRQKGFDVLEAVSGDQALKIWEEHQSEIEILFSDVVMPGTIDGLELGMKLRNMKPSLKVIITSGYYSEQNTVTQGPNKDFVFLSKPYTMNKLLNALEKKVEPATK